MAAVSYTWIDGEIVAEDRGGDVRDYVPDVSSSTAALLNSSQSTSDTFDYWPYGEVRLRTGATPTLFQFRGSAPIYRDSASRGYTPTVELDLVTGRALNKAPESAPDGEAYAYPPTSTALTFGEKKRRPFSLTDTGHGLYCGPDRNPFFVATEGWKYPKGLTPLDECCKPHDLFYKRMKCKGTPCVPLVDERAECEPADKDLCACAKGASCAGVKPLVRRVECETAKAAIEFLFCGPRINPLSKGSR